ncbi:MAG: tRNA pseudouridine(55) synthase TruB [Oscillospiraceae bacterium]
MSDLSGIIPVFKPCDWTSFDVVAKLRGILGIKRIGHGGTLDPMAEGVLPVFVGKAAKACDIIPINEKEYKAGFQLGIVTDTQDATGKVLEQSDTPCTRQQLLNAAENFVGDIMQLPPMYSAVSVGGKRLYKLAREGKTVEREPRSRRVNYLKILSYNQNTRSGDMLVSVSKGTYIRTLINDIGKDLGCGGIMTTLLRTRSAGFELEQCYTLQQIEKYRDNQQLEDIIIPVQQIFKDSYESIVLDEHCTRLYKNGVKLRLEQVGLKSFNDDSILCVFGCDSEFLGLAKTNLEENQLRIYKNFY